MKSSFTKANKTRNTPVYVWEGVGARTTCWIPKWGSAFVIPVRKQQFNVRNHLRALFSRVMIEENETHKQTREAKWVTRRRFIVVRLNSETESCQCVQERVSVVIGFKCGDPHCVVTYLSFWKIVPLFLCLIFARITAVFPPPTSLSCDKLLEL